MNTDAKLEEHHVVAMENVCPTTNISKVAAAFGYVAPESESDLHSCAPAVPQLRSCPVGWSIGSMEVPNHWHVAKQDTAATEQRGTPSTNSSCAISVW